MKVTNWKKLELKETTTLLQGFKGSIGWVDIDNGRIISIGLIDSDGNPIKIISYISLDVMIEAGVEE